MAETFDHIIVGAGSAGCVLANRLSEDPSRTVLLIEAGGGDRHPIVRIPLAAGLAYYWKAINWNYATTPQRGLGGRSIQWPRGKLLGGSSSINGMMYMRGNRRDYDLWRQSGLAGWSYEDVLPYFVRAEGHRDRAGPYHGTDGPLAVVKAKGEHPLYAAFLEAAAACGHPSNDDFNGATQEGLGLYDFNLRDGRRESSATAFLRPAAGRQNLAVWTKAQVVKINLEGRRAVSVTLARDGGEVTVGARCDIVLCGGAINTPALLQTSGIGPGDVLQAAGVETVVDAPVGKNLHDHLGVYLTYNARDTDTLYSLMRPDRTVAAALSTLLFGKGPGSSIPLEAGGFLRTREELEIPDIHITFVPGLNLETTRKGQGRHGYLINFYPLRPESRGEVRITSPDPREAPRIDPNYLATEGDRQVFRDGVRLARRIGAMEPLARHNAGEISPTRDIESDAEIDAWVAASANTIFHPVGTCRMGADDAAPLDGELRLRGVANLRVADASVMPEIIGGNTSAPTMMIAEKAADLILGRPPPAKIDLG